MGASSASGIGLQAGISAGGVIVAGVAHGVEKKASVVTVLPICFRAASRCLSMAAAMAASMADCWPAPASTAAFDTGATLCLSGVLAGAACWQYTLCGPAKNAEANSTSNRYVFCKQGMYKKFSNAYLESQVLSASPLQLVLLAYDGAITAITEARQHLAANRILERSKAVTKAQLIVMELQRSLDYEKGGDVALQLGRLYDYIARQLIEGNFRQQDAPLAEAQKLLETLDDSWKQLATQETQAQNRWEASESATASLAGCSL